MEIRIFNDKTCWVCGKEKENMTTHHALPNNLKPINNILVPVCESCHKRINIEDINGMYSYLFKIQKIFETDSKRLKVMFDNLNNLNKKG